MKKVSKALFAISAVFPAVLLLIFAACSPSEEKALDFEEEKKRIMHVIANETEMYYKQDFEGWKKNFLDSAAFRQYGYWEGWPQKVEYYNGFKALEVKKKNQFDDDKTIWKGSRETRDNENLRISRDMAWYTFEQKSFEKDTDKFLGKSLETRILEKVNGEWKIAYLGYHYFPTDTTAD